MTTEMEKSQSKDKVEFPTLQMSERKENDLPVSIKSLEEEELQIAELTEIERDHMKEVTTHLKHTLESLNTPLHIHPEAFSDVVLTPKGKIVLVNKSSVISSIPVESLPAPVLIKVLTEVVPEIKRILGERKIQMTGRNDLLEKSSKGFRKVADAIPGKSMSDDANSESSSTSS